MAPPIRILCVFATLDRGGAESMCMNLYRQIDRSKVQFDFVKHTSNEGEFEKEICSLGGLVFEAPRYKIINQQLYEKWWHLFFQHHSEYKIIHGHYFTISYVYFKIAHKYGLHTIGHAHSQRANYHSLKYWIKRQTVRWIERESDTCLACSKAAGEYLFPHKKFTVVHNAVDANKFSWNADEGVSVRKELGIGTGSLVVGVCGSFSHPKNPFGILDIFKAVHNKKHNSILLWVGDGELRHQIENQIQRLNLRNNIILTGMRADVHRIMQAMDVFILPSLWEGLAVVSIEAQASGLPCFFSDTITRECEITDLVQFLPLDSSDIWADSILKNKKIRKNTFREIVNAGYDIAASARWMENFYINLNEGIKR